MPSSVSLLCCQKFLYHFRPVCIECVKMAEFCVFLVLSVVTNIYRLLGLRRHRGASVGTPWWLERAQFCCCWSRSLLRIPRPMRLKPVFRIDLLRFVMLTASWTDLVSCSRFRTVARLLLLSCSCQGLTRLLWPRRLWYCMYRWYQSCMLTSLVYTLSLTELRWTDN